MRASGRKTTVAGMHVKRFVYCVRPAPIEASSPSCSTEVTSQARSKLLRGWSSSVKTNPGASRGQVPSPSPVCRRTLS